MPIKALCINQDSNRVQVVDRFNTDYSFSCTYEVINNNPKYAIEVGQPVLLLKNTVDHGLRFTHEGEVSHYLLHENLGDEPTGIAAMKLFLGGDNRPDPFKIWRHEFTVSYKSLEASGTDVPTVDLHKYSLPFITNYDKPEIHFKSYRFIEYEDFDNIRNQNIYKSRTVFGTLINSLPFENRLDLSTLIRNSYRIENPYLSDYRTATQLVIEFIKDGLYPSGTLLIESYNTLNKLKIPELPVDSIGFSTGNNDYKGDNLRNQKNRFINLLPSEKSIDPLDLFMNEIYSSQSDKNEIRFEKRFQNIRWPINLNNI